MKQETKEILQKIQKDLIHAQIDIDNIMFKENRENLCADLDSSLDLLSEVYDLLQKHL